MIHLEDRLAVPLLTLVLSAGALAQEAAPPSSGLLAEYERLAASYDEQRADFLRKMRAAESLEERQALDEGRPTKGADWTPRFWRIARAEPASEAGFRSLMWIRQHSADAEEGREVVALLFEHHLRHPRVGALCRRWVGNPHPTEDAAVEPLMRRLLEEIPHDRVRAEVAYCLARWLAWNDPEEHEAEIERLFELAVAQGKDLLPGVFPWDERPLAEAAASFLFAFRHLRPGCRAPALEGEDLEGRPLRLADHGGEVVLLSFYAHW